MDIVANLTSRPRLERIEDKLERQAKVKVKNTAALELEETRFLRWLDMSCILQIYRFYVGESTISRIISDLELPTSLPKPKSKMKWDIIKNAKKTERCADWKN